MNPNDEILEIIPCTSPFKTDEKIFFVLDEEGNISGEKYSLDEWIEIIKNISGINEELLGRSDEPK